MAADRHEEAILNAEVKRLVHALAPFGVLRRDVLAREVGASSWHEPVFEQALRAAVASGKIHKLPQGFYGLGGSSANAEPAPDGRG